MYSGFSPNDSLIRVDNGTDGEKTVSRIAVIPLEDGMRELNAVFFRLYSYPCAF